MLEASLSDPYLFDKSPISYLSSVKLGLVSVAAVRGNGKAQVEIMTLHKGMMIDVMISTVFLLSYQVDCSGHRFSCICSVQDSLCSTVSRAHDNHQLQN